jgi:hypothetical protein
MGYSRGPSLLTILYLAVGVIITADHNYLQHFDHIQEVTPRQSSPWSPGAASLLPPESSAYSGAGAPFARPCTGQLLESVASTVVEDPRMGRKMAPSRTKASVSFA